MERAVDRLSGDCSVLCSLFERFRPSDTHSSLHGKQLGAAGFQEFDIRNNDVYHHRLHIVNLVFENKR